MTACSLASHQVDDVAKQAAERRSQNMKNFQARRIGTGVRRRGVRRGGKIRADRAGAKRP